MPWTDRRQVVRLLAVAVPSLEIATLVVAYLQDILGVPNPSAIYLVAVVVTAYVSGTIGAIVAAIASFLLYNFLYTEPRYTFSINDPGVLLSVFVLLFVGIVVGQLAAVQRSRTEVARAREREAYALFKVSRALATRSSTPAVLREITDILGAQTQMDRVWIALGGDDASERIAADTADGSRAVVPGTVRILRRMPGDTPAEWMRVHQPSPRSRGGSGMEAYRVRIEAGGSTFGSVWALRDRGQGDPDRTEIRLLAAAADQVGQAHGGSSLGGSGQVSDSSWTPSRIAGHPGVGSEARLSQQGGDAR